jgi:hypothetical protein
MHSQPYNLFTFAHDAIARLSPRFADSFFFAGNSA